MKGELKQVYIPSLQAAKIYEHMKQGKQIIINYVGMIPASLELNQLIKCGLKTKENKTTGKLLSRDVINVCFGLRTEEMGIKELRDYLYINGFTLRKVEKETGEITETKYVEYKRSSAKSRTGETWFIREELYVDMIKWSHMGLHLYGRNDLDVPALRAYESLVASGIEDMIEINPDNIFVIPDQKSVFPWNVSAIKTNDKGRVVREPGEVMLENTIWDGQGLLDTDYYKDGKSMKLLRNHMFKCACLNTNVKQFLKDNCPEGIEYDNWQLVDAFGNEVYAKNIHMITTPSSLKFLKFSHVIGTQKEMWEHWKKVVKEEGSMFGVVKSEKASKFGDLQQLSYQFLNSLPATKEQMRELAAYELEYIKNLQNDDDFFIQHLVDNANETNSNLMWVELYKINPNIVGTELFRRFRTKTITGHKKHVKEGKLRVNGDYCVMFGNAYEMLLATVGKWSVIDEPCLKDNEVYTTLFEFEREYVGFRNPHSAQNNVLIVRNTYHEKIDRYFNLTKNVVLVNSCKFPLLGVLSGADFDSDTVCLIQNDLILSLARECQHYPIAVNELDADPQPYSLTNADKAKLDHTLSKSQVQIGKVVNLAQWLLSAYWHEKNEGKTDEELSSLLADLDTLVVFSGVAIDAAKKLYNVNMDIELNEIRKNRVLGEKKPMFFKYVSQDKEIGKKIDKYNCPMDYLYEIVESIKRAESKKPVDFTSLTEGNSKKANSKQKDAIIAEVKKCVAMVNEARMTWKDDEEKMSRAIEDCYIETIDAVKKRKLKKDTVYLIVKQVCDEKIDSQIATRLLNIIFKANKEIFLSVFKNSANKEDKVA